MTTAEGKPSMARTPTPCPICEKPVAGTAEQYPFCSGRCRTQDLANWATGVYSVPAPASEVDERVDPRRSSDESSDSG